MNSPAIGQAAAVHYRVDVIDAATGRLIRRLPRRRNLILDQGLDGIAVRSWALAFRYAAVGTGTTPTKRDSGAVTVSRAGFTLTASAGFFEAADVGRLFKFDSGEEVRISAYTDSTHVTTSTSGTIAAAEGTVWYVNQTALITETKRTGTYAQDGGSNGSAFSGDTYTHKRTFLFAAESGTVTYREIGWSHDVGSGANLFGRDLLAGAGVTLVAGQQLRVVVELSVAYSPASSVVMGEVGTGGISTVGTCGLESINTTNAGFVEANGEGSNFGAPGVLDPSGGGVIFAATDSAAIAPISTSIPGVSGPLTNKTITLGSYSAGSFTLTKSATFNVSEANSSAIRSLVLSRSGGYTGFRVRLDSAQTKTSAQTLTIGFTFSWGRILSNA